MFAYMAKHKKKSGFFKSREDVVSMFLGLVVVVAVVGFIVNFIEKRKGSVDVPGVSNDIKIEKNNLETNIASVDGENYVTVKKGDSLWKIAVMQYNDGYKWVEIAKVNNLNNPNVISDGDKLLLPKIKNVDTKTKIEEDTVALNKKTEYVVVKGDSLWKIATKVYGDGYQWTKIWQDNRNKLNSPDKLEVGMSLLIYGKI